MVQNSTSEADEDILPPLTTEALLGLIGEGGEHHETMTQLFSAIVSTFSSIPLGQYQFALRKWEEDLKVAYGEEELTQDLFSIHTQMTLLSKLICYFSLEKPESVPTDEIILSVVDGSYFHNVWGVTNIQHGDLFGWYYSLVAVSDEFINFIRALLQSLLQYDSHSISEDLLKGMYEGLIPVELRRQLGEFYTPDWLAHSIVNRCMDEDPEAKFLDPACGSGTFPFLVVREKILRLSNDMSPLELRDHIIENVHGGDLNPVSIQISKMNYLIAMSNILYEIECPNEHEFRLPLNDCDSLRNPTKRVDLLLGEVAQFQSGNLTINVPFDILDAETDVEMINFLNCLRIADDNSEGFESIKGELDVDYHSAINAARNTLSNNELEDWGKDLVIDNILSQYYTFRLKHSIDFIVGNPPWMTFQSLPDSYRDYLVKFCNDIRYITGAGESLNHTEFAVIFLLKCSQYYLCSPPIIDRELVKKDNVSVGSVFFVMPRSIFNGEQNLGFRSLDFFLPDANNNENRFSLVTKELTDCVGVRDLFPVASCCIRLDKIDNHAAICVNMKKTKFKKWAPGPRWKDPQDGTLPPVYRMEIGDPNPIKYPSPCPEILGDYLRDMIEDGEVKFSDKPWLESESSWDAQIITGSLPTRNASLTVAQNELEFTDTVFGNYHSVWMDMNQAPATNIPGGQSPYRTMFTQGLPVYPRRFYIVNSDEEE